MPNTPSINTPSINTTSNIVNNAINNSNLTPLEKQRASMSLTTIFIVWLLQKSPFVAGYGAISYSIGSWTNIELANIITNNTGRMILLIFIFICGIITVMEAYFLDALTDMMIHTVYNNHYL